MANTPANSCTTKNKDHLARLIEKQEEELKLTQEKVELWSKYKQDYIELRKLINSMQDKVKHPHRIPLAGTQLAFLPGHIIHTNELTVLLGDNIFALRSTKQATQIIDRRLENVSEMLKNTQEARKKTEDWLKVTRDHKQDKEQFVEIIETIP